MDLNFWLIILMVFLHFGGVLLFYFLWGKSGLFIFIPIAILIANIQVLKLVEVFGLATALGNAAYSSTFLVSDILSENHHKKEAKKAVWMGFFSLIFFSLILYLTLFLPPHPNDFSQNHLESLFSLVPRMTLAGLITYFLAQRFDVWFYHTLRNQFPKYLFIRNNLSTLISQAIDTFMFSFIAFGLSLDIGWIQIAPLYSFSEIWEIMFVAYLFKVIMSILDTPFIYLSKWIHKKRRLQYHD